MFNVQWIKLLQIAADFLALKGIGDLKKQEKFGSIPKFA